MIETVVAPAGTVREAGDAKSALLLLRLTTVPPLGAACEIVTLQVVEPPELSVVGLHVREDKVAVGFSVMVAVSELPFRVDVNTAVWVAEMILAVSTTEAVVAPAGTVREAGAAKSVLLLLKLTTVPPAGAACEMVTLQVVEPPELIVVKLHIKEVREVTVDSGVRVIVAVAELLLRLAANTAFWTAGTVPAVSATN
jgi:hypothetical protein